MRTLTASMTKSREVLLAKRSRRVRTSRRARSTLGSCSYLSPPSHRHDSKLAYVRDTLSGSSSTSGSFMTMLGVLFDIIKKPSYGLLVIVMLLTFKDNLLPSEDELVASAFGEVLFSKEVTTTIIFFAGFVFVLVWNTVAEVLLHPKSTGDLKAKNTMAYSGFLHSTHQTGLLCFRLLSWRF